MSKIKLPTMDERNAMIAELAASWTKEDDRRLNKARGILTRAQQQMGIPLSQETKQKISLALIGRTPSAATRAKISASLKAFHSAAKK